MRIVHLYLFIIAIICLMDCTNQPNPKLIYKTPKVQPHHSSTKVKNDANINQVIFGIYCGNCGKHCATMYRYSQAGKQGVFSVDYTDSFFKNSEINFNTYYKDNFHLNIGKEIIRNIPDSLLTYPSNSGRLGCPDCTDGCGIYFEIRKVNSIHKYYIDNQTSQLKGEIKVFADFLKAQIKLLNSRDHKLNP